MDINTVIAVLVTNTRVFFDNINDLAEVKLGLESKGYTDARLNVGRALFIKLDNFVQDYLNSVQARNSLKEKVDQALDLAYGTFRDTSHWMRRELSGDQEALEALGLVGARHRRGEKFIKQAHSLYETAINSPELLTKLEKMGLTAESLQAELNLVDAYRNLYSQWRKIRGECQRLVFERNKAYKAMNTWIQALVFAGKLAFKENPQILEKVGIFVRSQPKPRKKAGEPKEPGEPPQEPQDPPVDPPVEPPLEPPLESGAIQRVTG